MLCGDVPIVGKPDRCPQPSAAPATLTAHPATGRRAHGWRPSACSAGALVARQPPAGRARPPAGAAADRACDRPVTPPGLASRSGTTAWWDEAVRHLVLDASIPTGRTATRRLHPRHLRLRVLVHRSMARTARVYGRSTARASAADAFATLSRGLAAPGRAGAARSPVRPDAGAATRGRAARGRRRDRRGRGQPV